MKECLICREQYVNNPYVIHETENIIVKHGPLTVPVKGYFCIQFKRHVENWSNLTFEELSEHIFALKTLDKFLHVSIKADRVYSVTISEVLRHLHTHVIPRNEDSKLKGLDLIKQVTTSKAHESEMLNKTEIIRFLDQAKSFFKEESNITK